MAPLIAWTLCVHMRRGMAEAQPEKSPHRQPGALRGKIWIAPDFDALPPDLLSAMEGGEE